MLWSKKKKPPTSAKATHKSFKKSYSKSPLLPGDFRKKITGTEPGFLLSNNILNDRTRFFKNFLSLITRYYPVAASAVWTWKNLCTTNQDTHFIGGTKSSRNKSKEITDQLNDRISPLRFVKGGGMDFLLSLFFKYLFTYGRFAGELVLDNNNSMVETFSIIDPFKIKFAKINNELVPFKQSDQGILTPTNPNTFFYYALEMDIDNPYGNALLEAAWDMMTMADEMLQDMKLSSSNAGLPRLHIKISQPELVNGEDENDYVDRISTYFDSYVQQLSDIAPDDNFYSWNDVDISLVGGSAGAGGFVWRTNRQVFDEEILSAFHLFPWIVGKSTQTTKNWVRSQFDLLLSVVESLQKQASSFATWIRQVNLHLNGITDVTPIHVFERLRDPAAKDFAIAQRFKIANVITKIKSGIIDVNDGARELGYNKAHDPELIFKTKSENDNDTGANAEDFNTDSRIQKLEEKTDSLEYIIEQTVNDKIADLINKEK